MQTCSLNVFFPILYLLLHLMLLWPFWFCIEYLMVIYSFRYDTIIQVFCVFVILNKHFKKSFNISFIFFLLICSLWFDLGLLFQVEQM